MKADYGKTAADYSLYRAGFPDELFDRLARRGVGIAGQRVADIGAGAGAMARGFAKRGCNVVGVDISPELIEHARRLDANAGVSVNYVNGRAEDTGLSKDSFDAATAAVCWHWFDGPRAAAEIRRILRPGSRLATIHFDWLSMPGNIVAETERIIWNHVGPNRWKNKALGWAKEALSGVTSIVNRLDAQGFYPERLTTLAEAGYVSLESFSFDVDIPYTHDAWRGRIRSHADVGASQTAARIARVDADLSALLRENYPDTDLKVPHRIFVVTGCAPS